MSLKSLVLGFFVLTLLPLAHAEIDLDSPRASRQSATRKRTTTIIEKEEQGLGQGPDEEGIPNKELPKESEITAKFGSRATSGMSGCKTDDLSQKLVRELKSDCSAWLKDRKAELKGKYLTGSCEESCDDCGMHLQRCSVNGAVRYTVKTVE
jgi:hypothetical protein